MVLTISQAYGRFMMRLKDLKVYEQEKSLSKSIRQLRVLELKFDSSDFMLCLVSIDYTWL